MIRESARLEWQAKREDADKKHIETLRQQDIRAQHDRHWQNIVFSLLAAAISAIAALAGAYLARPN